MQILSRILNFVPREQSGKVPYYSNFISKIIRKFLKMNWILGKAPTLDLSLVTEGKEKLFWETNHEHYCQLKLQKKFLYSVNRHNIELTKTRHSSRK